MDVRPSADNPQHAAVVLADRRRFLSAFRDDELAVRRGADGAGKLAHVGGLRERVGEELVHVRFAVAIRVAQPPDAVAIECVDLVAADRDGQRLVQPRGETAPACHVAGFVQTAHEPDVAVERDQDSRAVAQELNVPGTHVASPRVLDRQLDVVHDERRLGL